MRILLSLFLLLTFIQADEVLTLHLLPCKHTKEANSSQTSAHHTRGGANMFEFIGFDDSFENTDITYITATLDEKKVDIKDKMMTPPRSGVENYHVLVANTSKDNKFYTAVYYKYQHGKPSRTSPTKLTSKSKGPFEIMPDPLPREHDRYYGSKTYSFLLEFQGKALANHKVTLNTQNGTTQSYTSGKNGEVEIVLPDDFTGVKVSKRGNKPAHFILSAQINNEGKEYFTTFANPYHVNPHDYWSSTSEAIIYVVLGLALGLFILWRRKNG